MKLDTEQEIINLKVIIEDREEEIARRYLLALTRRHLCNSATSTPLTSKGVPSYD